MSKQKFKYIESDVCSYYMIVVGFAFFSYPEKLNEERINARFLSDFHGQAKRYSGTMWTGSQSFILLCIKKEPLK